MYCSVAWFSSIIFINPQLVPLDSNSLSSATRYLINSSFNLASLSRIRFITGSINSLRHSGYKSRKTHVVFISNFTINANNYYFMFVWKYSQLQNSTEITKLAKRYFDISILRTKRKKVFVRRIFAIREMRYICTFLWFRARKSVTPRNKLKRRIERITEARTFNFNLTSSKYSHRLNLLIKLWNIEAQFGGNIFRYMTSKVKSSRNI